MSKANEPAFPVTETKETESVSLGMSLRTYLAGRAMMGLLANSANSHVLALAHNDTESSYGYAANDAAKAIAKKAVVVADALLEELEKTDK